MNIKGFTIELMGTPVIVVQIIISVGILAKNRLTVNIILAGIQDRKLDIDVTTNWAVKPDVESILDLDSGVSFLLSFRVLTNLK